MVHRRDSHIFAFLGSNIGLKYSLVYNYWLMLHKLYLQGIPHIFRPLKLVHFLDNLSMILHQHHKMNFRDTACIFVKLNRNIQVNRKKYNILHPNMERLQDKHIYFDLHRRRNQLGNLYLFYIEKQLDRKLSSQDKLNICHL